MLSLVVHRYFSSYEYLHVLVIPTFPEVPRRQCDEDESLRCFIRGKDLRSLNQNGATNNTSFGGALRVHKGCLIFLGIYFTTKIVSMKGMVCMK